ncbi:hypothetical protein [Knoellia sp. Soil729]|uniref:hypothetical protein n=1 Tax=Knoellia sp. Soil729 TaxID=1736394 RepID=UPI0012E7A2AC|nr:hypothetical protein [Knoellia sp. Soil729]
MQERDVAQGLIGAEGVGGVVAVVVDDDRGDQDRKHGGHVGDQLGRLARRAGFGAVVADGGP